MAVFTLAAILCASSAVLAADQKTTTKATKDTPAALQKEAKITEAQAREIAMKKFPNGKIESVELEREHGKLIYSFDIKTSKPGVEELQVSAISGKIVSLKHETPSKEAAEKKKEAQENKAAPKH